MKPLPALLLAGVLAGGGVAATAIAQSGSTRSPYELREPAVGASHLLHLSRLGPCTNARFVKVRVNPPTGAILATFRVLVDGREAVLMTGVPRAASATVRLPGAGGRVTATAETLGGQQVHASRNYRRCSTAKPPPPPTGPPVTGGGST
ncbi:MAG TPA: hypothetical protein VH418_12610 [Solirubrobacteraceae bacterium]